ncbi:hypothetical protein H310_02644 [Aphanomyces invadans]|uniref:Uncharacterized protein n=1 Tax=Aphanomyces invadans TaxID=157072 RepID=A0A024UIW2_9STRA|nr:hypothetical protein H310_02644 [Aphanomyces invadans]ETW06366.1 hypothetical protein H310_02644 [Aphanomyces invadans]RHY23532.1 hypothetical protein DYB32_009154 [Aphanomyces invadans]|eukprot:XP_008864441.1 hypothetical protein H310_02644 [Aphanomyces invadans]
MQLLHELLASYDDAKNEERDRLDEAKREAERIEALGKNVREEALQSLGKRKASDDPETSGGGGGGSKFLKIVSMMNEDNKAELEFRKFQYIKDLEERQKDRDLFLEQSRMQYQTMMNLLAALSNKQ